MRTDLQALRGIAVTYVLFYHAGIGSVEAGYLGVDIFFVVSGFLITGIVRDELLAGTFSFRRFYMRRARRLLPAALVVLAACAAASGYFLSNAHQAWFYRQLVGAMAFLVNFELWLQVDYFAPAADKSPLLHMWSLAIEEQYYLLLPAALALLRPAWWGWALACVVVASFAACLATHAQDPAAAFYLLPTRAWELCIGSVGAIYAERWGRSPWVSRLSPPALTTLLVIPFAPTGAPHPGLDAALICTATLILLLRREDTVWPPVQLMASIGDRSYSLYLVHWPLFAFATNVYVSSTIPADVRAGLLGLSLVLGYLLYRLVEQPFRARELILNFGLAVRFGLANFAIAGLWFASTSLWTDARQIQDFDRPNWGFSRDCVQNKTFAPSERCRNVPADDVEMIVWGDSFAMHLVPGLAAQPGARIEQATTEACGPLRGIAPRNEASYTRRWAEFCLDFSESVVTHIANSSAEIVVLSTSITQYVEDTATVLSVEAGGFLERPGSLDLAMKRLSATVSALRAARKRVVVVSAPPRANYDLPECLVRRETGRLVLGYFSDCQMSMEMYRSAAPASVTFFERLETEADVPVIRLEDYLCSDRGTCLTELDGTVLYRDRIHLSVDGSTKLAETMGWLTEIRARAR
ncbi:MAG: acyltransferase family protein [Pseudomonadota bacterium]